MLKFNCNFKKTNILGLFFEISPIFITFVCAIVSIQPVKKPNPSLRRHIHNNEKQ